MIPWKDRIEPYSAQQAAIWDPPDNAIIVAAPKTGKTIGSLQWLIEETERMGEPHRRFLWVSPVFRQSQIAFRRAYTELLDLAEIKVHKTDYTITMPNETVIFFGSGDKADNIYGEDYWGVVVEEATRTSLEAWIAITSTTQHTAPRMRLIGNNTRRPNWAKKLAIQARKGELPGWVYSRLESDDALAAGVINQRQFDMTRLLIPEDEWLILYGNVDVDRGGIYLDTFKITEIPLPDVRTKVRAWDLASTEGGDFTVGALIEANSDGYWISDIVRERRDAVDVPELVADTAAMDGPDVDQVFEEERGSAGMLVTEFMTRLLDVVPTAGPVWPAKVETNKQIRAWPLAAQTRAGRVHFASGFHHSEALTEMEEWPDSANDDVIDALAHGVNHLAPLVEGMVGSGWVPGQAAS